jgi:2',3'-cyclic-nucleotide 2'-phosphodiesterase (5'-nucleotidase family)
MKNIFAILFSIFILVHVSFAQNSTSEKHSSGKLTILYTNDLHSHLEPLKVGWVSETRKVGGFANIATIVKNKKSENPNTLYFDAGDFFTGPSYCSLTKGEAIIDVMNTIPIDAACIGNHEFDYGWQNMIEQFTKAKFPILNCNIFIQNSDRLVWNNPYIILNRNGIRIGVIGLHGKFAFYDTVADLMMQGIEARDEEVYLQKYIDLLSPKVDIIILLVHEGIPGRQSSKGSGDISRNLQKDIELAQKVKGIDILITGHAHQGTPQPLVSNGTIIVSTDALGIEVGRLDVHYDKHQDKITHFSNVLDIVYDDEIKDDSVTSLAIAKWKNKLNEITNEKVCSISQPLTRSYGEESFLGNMVTDAMLQAFPANDFALTNSGGLREDISGSDVTVGNLISAFPFPNTVVEVQIKGKDLKGLFEHAASQTNGVLQASKGVEMIYNDSLPVGNRVVSCKIKGAEIEEDKIYKVLTNNFLAEGGDGFLSFKNAISKKDTYTEIVQTMIQYMKSFDVYIPKLEGRIVKAYK